MPANKPSPEAANFLCDVTDSRDRPLLAMPLGAVLRQQLYYRLVALALYTKEGALCLRKRHAFPSKDKNRFWWGLLVTPVAAGEPREDAALRLMRELLSESAPRFAAPFHLPLWHNMHGSLYRAVLPTGIRPPVNEDWLLADEDEAEGLFLELPEMISPEAIWAFEERLLFPHRNKAPDNRP